MQCVKINRRNPVTVSNILELIMVQCALIRLKASGWYHTVFVLIMLQQISPCRIILQQGLIAYVQKYSLNY